MEGSSFFSDEEERGPPQDVAASSSLSSDEEDWTQAKYQFSLLTAGVEACSTTAPLPAEPCDATTCSSGAAVAR